MKKITLLLTCFCFANLVLAQSPFINISYDSALVLSKEKGKLIMVYIPSTACKECNHFFDSTISVKKNAQAIAANFIPIKLQKTDRTKYSWLPDNENIDFGIFYIDAKEELVYTSNLLEDFSKEATLVQSKYKKIKALQELENSYFDAGKKSLTELEKLLKIKAELKQDNYLLLNSYASLLPKDSLNSPRVLRFLLRQIPTYESKADTILRSSTRTEKAWNSLTFEEQNNYNSFFFEKSLALAVKFKDEAYLQRLATFSANRQKSVSGQQDAFEGLYISYFSSISDTARLMMVATSYYDRMVQNLPRELFTADWEKAVRKSQVNVSGGVTMPTLRAPSFYAEKLTSIANFIYEFDKNNFYTNNALNWAKTATELDMNRFSAETYSRLLRKAGKTEEADAYEKKMMKELKVKEEEWKMISEMMQSDLKIRKPEN